jgi:hypothetical protein
VRARHLVFAIMLPVIASGQARATSPTPLITGDTVGAACSATSAASDIQAWFAALSIGDTAGLRRLAAPALIVFSAGRNGLRERFARADNVDQLLRYAIERHRAGDRWSLLEVRFVRVRGKILGFMPITRRESRDRRATKGLWLGKAEYECGRGVRVLNLAPWPSNIPPYQPSVSRPPAERS